MGNAEYPFTAIAPRSTLARSGSTWWGPIYGLNRTCSKQNAAFFFKHFIKIQMVQPYNSTHMAITSKNSRFILSGGSNIHMHLKFSIAIHALPMHMLTLLSVDEILLLKYMNWSTNFRGLPFKKVWFAFITHQPLWVINAKSIFIYINSSISNNSI